MEKGLNLYLLVICCVTSQELGHESAYCPVPAVLG